MARPKKFEVDEALEAALNVFWNNGYSATSLSDLIVNMGLNKGSLYGTFGDKHTLFMAALDRYEQKGLQRMQETLERPSSVKAVIRDWMLGNYANCKTDEGYRGCFHYNTILEMTSHDKVIAKRLKQYAQSLEQIMQQALERGKAEGEFASDLDSKRMAKFLMNTNAGLQVTMKLSSSKREFQALVEIALSILN